MHASIVMAMRRRVKTRVFSKQEGERCSREVYTLWDYEKVHSVRRGSVLQKQAELACTERIAVEIGSCFLVRRRGEIVHSKWVCTRGQGCVVL